MENIDWIQKAVKLGNVLYAAPYVNKTSSKDERRFFLYHIRVVDGIISFDDPALWAGQINEVTTQTEK